jgi:hypothetical protein
VAALVSAASVSAQSPSPAPDETLNWPSSNELRRELQLIGYDFEFIRGDDVESSTWVLHLGGSVQAPDAFDPSATSNMIVLTANGDRAASVLFSPISRRTSQPSRPRSWRLRPDSRFRLRPSSTFSMCPQSRSAETGSSWRGPHDGVSHPRGPTQ